MGSEIPWHADPRDHRDEDKCDQGYQQHHAAPPGPVAFDRPSLRSIFRRDQLAGVSPSGPTSSLSAGNRVSSFQPPSTWIAT
jgi:hypothetical protein